MQVALKPPRNNFLTNSDLRQLILNQIEDAYTKVKNISKKLMLDIVDIYNCYSVDELSYM